MIEADEDIASYVAWSRAESSTTATSTTTTDSPSTSRPQAERFLREQGRN